MGKLIVEQIVTADGFAARRDGDIAWFEKDATLDEMTVDQLEMLKGVDAMLLGANTYKMFSEFWPTATEEPASFINGKPKHVFSKSMTSAPWGDHAPATVEGGELANTVAALRERYRGDLILWGSLSLAESLFRAKAVDLLRLRIVPVLIGEGRSVAPAGTTRLELDSATTYPKGHVVMQYRVR